MLNRNSPEQRKRLHDWSADLSLEFLKCLEMASVDLTLYLHSCLLGMFMLPAGLLGFWYGSFQSPVRNSQIPSPLLHMVSQSSVTLIAFIPSFSSLVFQFCLKEKLLVLALQLLPKQVKNPLDCGKYTSNIDWHSLERREKARRHEMKTKHFIHDTTCVSYLVLFSELGLLEPHYPFRYKVVSNVPIANTVPGGWGHEGSPLCRSKCVRTSETKREDKATRLSKACTWAAGAKHEADPSISVFGPKLYTNSTLHSRARKCSKGWDLMLTFKNANQSGQASSPGSTGMSHGRNWTFWGCLSAGFLWWKLFKVKPLILVNMRKHKYV